jgi:hypothetical protein
VGATRFYRARLSNQDVIFVYACAVQSLKGLFQPRKITAAMITITIDSRRMTTETEQRRRVRAMEIVPPTSRSGGTTARQVNCCLACSPKLSELKRYHAWSSAFTRLRAAEGGTVSKVSESQDTGFLTTDDTDLTDGESSGLSVLCVVSVFCLFMVSQFQVRLRLLRKAAGSKTGGPIPAKIGALGAPTDADPVDSPQQRGTIPP